MLERIIHTRNFLSMLLAFITGLILYVHYPFPHDNLILQFIAMKDPLVYSLFVRGYTLFMFTTPWIAYSSLFSLVYIFGYKRIQSRKPVPLPPYPDPRTRTDLFVILGEQHHPTKPIPSPDPQWLKTPERGLCTGVAIIGAIGSGKTAGAMRPYADQLIGFQAGDPSKRIGGLILEVKGDFCYQVREVLAKYGRQDGYVEISLDCDFRYNPLHNEMDAFSAAYAIAQLLNNLFGKSDDPFWQQAYTSLLNQTITLHRLLYSYVTLFDLYECAISPARVEFLLKEAERQFQRIAFNVEDFGQVTYYESEFAPFRFDFDNDKQLYTTPNSSALEEVLANHQLDLKYSRITEAIGQAEQDRKARLDAVKRWYYNDWARLDTKTRTSIVEGISVFLSVFDSDPVVKRIFCPPKETYDPALNTMDANGNYKYGRPFPSFRWLIEEGKVCALNFPVSASPGLARVIGTMMKLDYQRAVLLRIPDMARNTNQYFRQVFFICDEYQDFATVGGNEPVGDEKFFSKSRQAKCIPIVATQSISSLKSTLPAEGYRTLLQTFRTKIFLALSDDLSTEMASKLCGKEDKPQITYTISEQGQDSKVSLLTGKTASDKSSISASKNYSTRQDFRFPPKVFAELPNMQAIVLPYDGLNPRPATLCYLKPYYRDPNVSYFEQLKRGWL